MRNEKRKHQSVPTYQQMLYNQIIDENQPGAILRDFETILDFVKEKIPLKVTATAKLPPMKLLPELNARLTRSLKLDLKRPQHKSFPNILGIYLLLRANGIAFIEGSGTQQQLMVAEEILNSWRSLNSTEKYFTLLETALLRADPQILGEREARTWDNPLYNWSNFFRRIPEEGLSIAGDNRNEDMLKTVPGHYNLTLMDSFGVIAIEDADPEAGKGWRILSIQKTPFGEAVFQELADSIPTLEDIWGDREEGTKRTPVFGELQSKFQPFFPEWQHNLEIPKFDPQPGTYIFKIFPWKDVWRRMAVPGSTTLDDVSNAILEAFKFDDPYHLYRFIYTDHFGAEQYIEHPELHIQPFEKVEGPFTDTVTVQDVPLRAGRSMIFFFDFGDCWEFEMFLEDIAPVDPALGEPQVLEKKGKAPKQYGW